MNTGFNSRLQSNEKGEAEECQGGREPGGGAVCNTDASTALPLLISPRDPDVFFIQT